MQGRSPTKYRLEEPTEKNSFDIRELIKPPNRYGSIIYILVLLVILSSGLLILSGLIYEQVLNTNNCNTLTSYSYMKEQNIFFSCLDECERFKEEKKTLNNEENFLNETQKASYLLSCYLDCKNTRKTAWINL